MRGRSSAGDCSIVPPNNLLVSQRQGLTYVRRSDGFSASGGSITLNSASQPQAHGADPLGIAAGSDEVALAVDKEEVDRGRSPLAAPAAPHRQNARATETDPQRHEEKDRRVRDAPSESVGLLIGQHPRTCIAHQQATVGLA